MGRRSPPALAIAAFARSDELLVDTTTVEATDRERFDLQAARDVISLDRAPSTSDELADLAAPHQSGASAIGGTTRPRVG